MTDKQPSKSKDMPFDAFFSAVLDFVTNVPKEMVKACGNDPDVEQIKANASLVQGQLGKVFDEARREYSASSILIKNQVSDIVRVSDGVRLASLGEATAKTSISKGLFGGGFFSWISKHLAEIKKLIRVIVTAIFGRVPEWLDTILVLIDELWEMIVELLGGVFGLNRRELAREISSGHVNYLNELAALERLKTATYEAERGDDD